MAAATVTTHITSAPPSSIASGSGTVAAQVCASETGNGPVAVLTTIPVATSGVTTNTALSQPDGDCCTANASETPPDVSFEENGERAQLQEACHRLVNNIANVSMDSGDTLAASTWKRDGNCAYKERIIDFENFRIIEHVIDSSPDDEREELEAEVEAEAGLIGMATQEEQASAEGGDQKTGGEEPNDMKIAYIGLIDNSHDPLNGASSSGSRPGYLGVSPGSVARGESAVGVTNNVTLPTLNVDDNNNNKNNNNNNKANNKSDVYAAPTDKARTRNSTEAVPAPKSLNSKLTPLAPPFQPAAMKARLAMGDPRNEEPEYDYAAVGHLRQPPPAVEKSRGKYHKHNAGPSGASAAFQKSAGQKAKASTQPDAAAVTANQSLMSTAAAAASQLPYGQQSCMQHGLAGLPMLHLTPPRNPQSSAAPGLGEMTAGGQLIPVQLIAVNPGAQQAATLNGAVSGAGGPAGQHAGQRGVWPLVEAPIYIDANGEFRSYCPAHGPPQGMGSVGSIMLQQQPLTQSQSPQQQFHSHQQQLHAAPQHHHAHQSHQQQQQHQQQQPQQKIPKSQNLHSNNNISNNNNNLQHRQQQRAAASVTVVSSPPASCMPLLQLDGASGSGGTGSGGGPTNTQSLQNAGKHKLLKGPATVQMVSQNRAPPIPVSVQVTPGQMVQQYVNENATLTHVVLSPQQYQPLHTGQGHIHSPFLTTNGTSHFYSPLPSGFQPGAGPTHFHTISGSGHMQPPPQQPPGQPGQAAQPGQTGGGGQQAGGGMPHNTHSPSPPNSYHKDERTQRQYNKLLKKLEKQREYTSGFSTPAHSPSPRRNDLNGHPAGNASAPAHLLGNNGGGAANNSAVNFAPPTGQYHYVQQQMHQINHHNNHHNRRGMSRRNGNGTAAPPTNLHVSGGGGPSSVGTSEDGEDTSSVAEEEEDYQASIVEQLSAIQKPDVMFITSRSAKIVWEAPVITDSLLNTADLQYNVLLSDRAKECQYKSLYRGESYDCIVQDLQPGQVYLVRLQVHYNKLIGSPSEPTEFRTPACEPDQPAPPKLQNRSKNSLHLRWAVPPSNGSPIVHYQLEYDEGKPCGQNASAPTTPSRPGPMGEINFVELVKVTGKNYLVKKLQPSTMYSFRLAAVNEVGPSPYSAVCCFSTSGNPPSAPKAPTLQSATSFSIRLLWERRPQDGVFVLQMLDRDTGYGYLNVYNGVETHYECCHLKRSAAYHFRLRSENEFGNSPWSSEVVYTTAPERPGRPGKPYAKGKVHSNLFKVRWDPPADKGGAEIVRYFLEISTGANGKFECVYKGAEPETTCDRLQPGTAYQLRASCEGPAGISTYSEVASITSEAIVPAVPPPPHYDNPPGPYGAVLRLEKPDYNGGAPVLELEVQMRLAAAGSMSDPESQPFTVYRGKDTYCVIKQLKPGHSYEAQVRAVNRIGAGGWSAWFRFCAAAAPPEAPEGAKVLVKSATHLQVSWQEPESNGSPISEYRLESAVMKPVPAMEISPEESSSETSAPPSTAFQMCYHGLQPNADLRNLLPYTLYYFRVNASNTAGVSKWSALVNVKTPAAVPAAPQIKDYEFTATEAKLRWSSPESNGSAICGYTIEYGDRSVTTASDATEYTLTGLTPQTPYRIRVQAVNSVGSGPFSPYTKLTTLPLPPRPPALECAGVGHNFIKLKWGDGRNPDFTKFYVEMFVQRAREFQLVYSGINCMYKMNKLQERTAYTFRIYAGNDKAGVGDYSEEYVFRTTATLPNSIKAPRIALEGFACLVPGGSGASPAAASSGSGSAAFVPSGYLPETPTSYISGLGKIALGVPLMLEWQHSRNSFSDRVEYMLQYAIGKDGDFKKIYRGPETKFTIENLEPNTTYQFRVCPIRVTQAGEDLAGQYTSAFRYQVPNLPLLDEIDSTLLSNPMLGAAAAAAASGLASQASAAAAAAAAGAAATAAAGGSGHNNNNNGGGGGGGSGSNPQSAACHGHAHHSHHHAHHAHTHSHHPHQHSSRSSMPATATSHLHQRSVSANSGAANASSPSAGVSGMPRDPNMANELAANIASCDDPHHHHHHHFHQFPGASGGHAAEPEPQPPVAVTSAATLLAASNLLLNNQLLANATAAAQQHNSPHHPHGQQQHGALRRFASKLTSVYTNRKRFTDQQKAFIYMFMFLLFTFVCASLCVSLF